MKKFSNSRLMPLAFLLIILVLSTRVFGGTTKTILNPENWPAWPEKATVAPYRTPPAFLTLGREAVSWVIFNDLEDAGLSTSLFDSNFTTAEVITMLQSSSTSFDSVPINFSSGSLYYSLSSGDTQDLNVNQALLDQLTSRSIFKTSDTQWATVKVNNNAAYYVPNQSFSIAKDIPKANDWLKLINAEGDLGFNFADSGHAYPLLVWQDNGWLESFVPDYNYNFLASTWVGHTYLFQPTNQGFIYGLDLVKGTSPSVNLKWGLMPNPSFYQSIYQMLWKQYGGKYPRVTALDGPITVYDIQDNSGNWKRMLVGTTGTKTKFVNKPTDAWEKLGEESETFSVPTSLSILTSETAKNTISGIYTLDISNPLAPKSIWSVTNLTYERTTSSYSYNTIKYDRASTLDDLSAGDKTDYGNFFYCNSRPIVGFVEDSNGNRTWLILAIVVDKDNHYRWYKIDANTGDILNSGIFANETAGMIDLTINNNSQSVFVEEAWPSRILAAYPRYSANYGGLPVMSDVYIFLSSGAFYKWNLQDNADAAPEKIFTMQISNSTGGTQNAIVPPVTDFDITYLDGTVYMAGTVYLGYNGNSARDSIGLIVVDLGQVTGDISLMKQSGINGDDRYYTASGNSFAIVQLQTSVGSGQGGANAYDLLPISSPVFLNKTIYMPVYVASDGEKKNGRWSASVYLSRIYTISDIAGFLKGSTLVEGTHYDDLDNQIAVAMVINEDGQLQLIDEEGNVIATYDTGLSFSSGGGLPSLSTTPTFEVKYWKIRS